MSAKTLPTVGHHFSDFLICRQKAWLHYHGNHRAKMKPPVYLRVMQAEGQRLEAQVYETRYPGAFKVPGFGTKSSTRLLETREAMERGEPVILQGYVETPNGTGTMDVMERVGADPASSVGYAYRVGEIKRSEKLMTAHIMQVSWYAELLEQAYGQKVRQGFFLLGAREKQIREENLDNYSADYQKIKSELFALRDTNFDPGPHLIPACSACDWRGVCMPRLIQEEHLSLLPMLTPDRVSSFKSAGICRWQDIAVVDDDAFIQMGMTPFEISLVRKGLENLNANLAPLRNQFRSDLFDDAVAVSLDFLDLAPPTKAESVSRPSSIHWYEGEQLYSQSIQYDGNGVGHVNLDALLDKKMLVFYGGTDLGAFVSIMENNPGVRRPELFDLFQFIEEQVHAPFIGLELRSLIRHILKQDTEQTGAQRAWAIMQVMKWLRASL